MLFSKEYVGYLARQITNRLVAADFIETTSANATIERLNNALVDELSLEDRINEEARTILEAYSEEMRQGGANYQEAFKKVKNELVKRYKVVL
jgi:hypothetical protein